jgi:hypothetical protein
VHRENGHLVVHAGILPSWSAEDALRLAVEAQQALQGRDAVRILESLGEPSVRPWSEKLQGAERLRLVIQAFTRLRTCTRDGVPCLDFSGTPAEAPEGEGRDGRVRALGGARPPPRVARDRPRHRCGVGKQAHRDPPEGPCRLPGAVALLSAGAGQSCR